MIVSPAGETGKAPAMASVNFFFVDRTGYVTYNEIIITRGR